MQNSVLISPSACLLPRLDDVWASWLLRKRESLGPLLRFNYVSLGFGKGKLCFKPSDPFPGSSCSYVSQAYVCDTIFPISWLGNCLASCLLSRPAPRNRQESHTVSVLSTQLLLNVGSLKVEHQHTFIPYLHSNNQRERQGLAEVRPA